MIHCNDYIRKGCNILQWQQMHLLRKYTVSVFQFSHILKDNNTLPHPTAELCPGPYKTWVRLNWLSSSDASSTSTEGTKQRPVLQSFPLSLSLSLTHTHTHTHTYTHTHTHTHTHTLVSMFLSYRHNVFFLLYNLYFLYSLPEYFP